MKNHLWMFILIALAIAFVAGCSSKQNTSQQSANNTPAQRANAAPADKGASNTRGNVADDSTSHKAVDSSVAASSTESQATVATGSAKPAKAKAKSAVAATGATTAKPAANETDVKKTDPKKGVKPQLVANSPKQLPKLLDLGATKCVPCKMMVPVLNELTKEYKGKLQVEFIDVWQNPSAAEKYNVQSIPTQIFFDAKGKEVYRHVGFFPKEDILKSFREKGIKL